MKYFEVEADAEFNTIFTILTRTLLFCMKVKQQDCFELSVFTGQCLYIKQPKSNSHVTLVLRSEDLKTVLNLFGLSELRVNNSSEFDRHH